MNVIHKTFKTETAHIVRKASSTRCRYNVHGHSYKWVVHIKSHHLNEAGMVMDFKDMSLVKTFIDQFDHSMVLWSKEDPKITKFFLKNFKRVIIMEQNPTAENMARLVFQFCEETLPAGVMVHKVEVWETETGCAEATESHMYDTIKDLQVEE